MRWDALLFVAALLVFIAFLIRFATRRRRPETFLYDGRTYQRRPDGSFIGANGLLVSGAMATILAGAYQSHSATQASSGWSWSGGGSSDSSGGDGDCGGDGGGGDGGGGDGGGSD